MRSWLVNTALVVAAVAVFGIALVLGADRGEFAGTDAAATEEVLQVSPGYEPWFEPVWTQPGGEVESGLFALQAALGAGVLGYALGAMRERGRRRRTVQPAD